MIDRRSRLALGGRSVSKIESAFVAFIIGPVVPVVFSLFGWWGSLSIASESLIPVAVLTGLGIGIAVDIAFLKRWVQAAYSWNKTLLLAILLFYSMCVFGFFMGVPVFNLAVGVVAGLFWGRRSLYFGADRRKAHTDALMAARAAALTIGVVSLAAAYFAVRDFTDTARNLQGMLGLPFTPTGQMVIALIVIGGPALIVAQYWSTKRAALWAYRSGLTGRAGH